jgi:hypothetical protein
MNEHEEKVIAAFIVKEKQNRYRFLLNSSNPKRRIECVNGLNHCRDLNLKYVTWLPSNAAVLDLLKREGSPAQVYLISGSRTLDGHIMPLEMAVAAVDVMPENGWGTIISCIPGQLAYYYDEGGERRALLKRKPGT